MPPAKLALRPQKPRIEGFLTPKDVGTLRPSDSLAPGAFEAIRRGCTCDRFANEYGKGIGNGWLAESWRYEVDRHCPLHGSSIPSVPIAPQRCPHCGEDLELAADGKTVSCANHCEVLVVGPPEAAQRQVRTDPLTSRPICARCDKPIEHIPGRRGRRPKFHDTCRTPAELQKLADVREYMRGRWEASKRPPDGAP
jgi:hypothetical protein